MDPVDEFLLQDQGEVAKAYRELDGGSVDKARMYLRHLAAVECMPRPRIEGDDCIVSPLSTEYYLKIVEMHTEAFKPITDALATEGKIVVMGLWGSSHPPKYFFQDKYGKLQEENLVGNDQLRNQYDVIAAEIYPKMRKLAQECGEAIFRSMSEQDVKRLFLRERRIPVPPIKAIVTNFTVRFSDSRLATTKWYNML